MSTIAEYNPIIEVMLSNTTLQQVEGLVVIVGPNSCGKTNLLADIERAVLGVKNTPEEKLKVAKEILAAAPEDLKRFVKDMLDQKLIRPESPDSFRGASPYYGSGSTGDIKINHPQLQKAHGKRHEGDGRHLFFSMMGRLLLTSLFVANRMTLFRSVDRRTDPSTEIPENELQALQMDEEAQDALEEETSVVFGNAVFVDTQISNKVRLKVSGSPEKVPHRDRNFPKRAEKYWLIDTEGDGYKSYVGICIALLLGRRPVCIIDEPEMCLHPPQEHAIGKFIGKYGSRKPHVTFVATHSSYVLKGMIETAENITVLRLTEPSQISVNK